MRNRARVFGCLLVGTSMISITQPTTAAAAVQASQTVRFYDIPAQPLGSALSFYAEVSGVDLVANPAAVKGKRSHAIKGNFSPEDALNEILRGTSLDYRMSSNGSVIVGGTMGYIPAKASVGMPAWYPAGASIRLMPTDIGSIVEMNGANLKHFADLFGS